MNACANSNERLKLFCANIITAYSLTVSTPCKFRPKVFVVEIQASLQRGYIVIMNHSPIFGLCILAQPTKIICASYDLEKTLFFCSRKILICMKTYFPPFQSHFAWLNLNRNASYTPRTDWSCKTHCCASYCAKKVNLRQLGYFSMAELLEVFADEVALSCTQLVLPCTFQLSFGRRDNFGSWFFQKFVRHGIEFSGIPERKWDSFSKVSFRPFHEYKWTARFFKNFWFVPRGGLPL